MNTALRLLTLIAAIPALVAPAVAAPPQGADYHIDGIKLGAPVSSALLRTTYRSACDVDPIEDRTRRIVVYTDRPCRHKSFPKQSSLALFFGYSKVSVFDGAIEAIAWMGGSFFSDRTDFPGFVGMSKENLTKLLGAPKGRFTVPGRKAISVTRYGADIYALFVREIAVGFVLGTMPKDPNKESWRTLGKLYHRYTTAVVSEDGSVAKELRCTAFVNRVLQLKFAEKTQRYHAMNYAEQLEKKHKKCVHTMTDEALECALGTGSMTELDPCLAP